MDTNKSVHSVDAYIAAKTETQQLKLQEMRSIIRTVLPGAPEVIAWGMPSYRGHPYIVHFAGHKAHLGLYPGAEAIEHFQDRLKDFHTSKGAIQFPYDKPLPVELITDIVRYCATEDLARA